MKIIVSKEDLSKIRRFNERKDCYLAYVQSWVVTVRFHLVLLLVLGSDLMCFEWDSVESCPLTKLNGSLSRLHSADEDAVSLLTSYGSCNAYEKKKKTSTWPHLRYDVGPEEGEYEQNFLCATVLCVIIIVHNGMSSSYSSFDYTRLWFCLVSLCIFEHLCIISLHGAMKSIRDTTVSAEGNGDLQTLICVLAARPRRCPTLSNPVLWQSWMAAYPDCTLQMKTLFPGWPNMVRDMPVRRRRWCSVYLILFVTLFTFQWAEPGGITWWDNLVGFNVVN